MTEKAVQRHELDIEKVDSEKFGFTVDRNDNSIEKDPKGPSKAAGLFKGDIIREINGEKVLEGQLSQEELIRLLTLNGNKLKLSVDRISWKLLPEGAGGKGTKKPKKSSSKKGNKSSKGSGKKGEVVEETPKPMERKPKSTSSDKEGKPGMFSSLLGRGGSKDVKKGGNQPATAIYQGNPDKKTGDLTDGIDVTAVEGGVERLESIKAFRTKLSSSNSLLDFKDNSVDLDMVREVVANYKQNSVKKRKEANPNLIGKFSQANMIFEELSGPVAQTGRK